MSNIFFVVIPINNDNFNPVIRVLNQFRLSSKMIYYYPLTFLFLWFLLHHTNAFEKTLNLEI